MSLHRKKPKVKMKIWGAKIGEVEVEDLPQGSDAPMREGIRKAYLELTGSERQRREDLCLKCMECCKVISVQAPYCLDNKEFIEFYHTRGCAIIATKSLPVIVIENRCPHLTDKGCDIYNRRPEWCRMYDGRIDPVLRHVCLWGKEEQNGRT